MAGALAARRTVLNQRVAEARHRWPSLDLPAFAGFVGGTLDEVCQAVEGVDVSATTRVCEVAFELGLDLVAQGYAGPKARLPWVENAWRSLAPSVAPLLAREPLETLGAITNAAVRLGSLPDIRVAEWISLMVGLARQCDSVQTLRDLGAVCAWRAGMTHMRGPALTRADSLPASLAIAAVGGVGTEWSTLRERMASERWWNPSTADVDAQGRSVGGFTGLGGPFAVPPQVRAVADGFVAESGGRYYLVLADAYGAVVLPASAEEFAAGTAIRPRDLTITREGIFLGRMQVQWAVTGDRMQAVVGPAGIAIFSPWSHHVRVMPTPR
ncbi:hypothetical protein [Pseudoxanthomonas daejeonensis]|uniref:hypothetical protein n=1 Tax=Pseudoxanthomonas daejeonensis TaxID=266062 RepID=UPI001391B0C4|nr:hypothetical protein [Pseudoxanthomonas daejeonensis]